MNANEIKGNLLIAGSNASKIAAELKVSRQAVHQTILGQNASVKIREAIAVALGKSVSDIWPDTKPDKQAA